ncbi:hypothetical protein GGS21DRAFT_528821 [Xylaria nigripes]|nr:hypothetical protein GGS21DRAFT_528821 [Xylaria nigripes]
MSDMSESTPTHNSVLTPSTTMVGEPGTFEAQKPFSVTGGMGSAPEPGGLYMIRDLDSDKVLAVRDGRLMLTQDTGMDGGWQWYCVENHESWLGFREKASGRYLGRDGNGGFCANAYRFDAWEKMCLRPVKSGGYHIMATHWWTLLRMGTRGRSDSFAEVHSAGEAIRWEFVEL